MSGHGQSRSYSDRQAAADAVNGAQSMLSMYPMASTSQAAQISQHLGHMSIAAPPASYMQPSYYSMNPPPYSEHDYNWNNSQQNAVHLLQQQQQQGHQAYQNHFPVWSPPSDQSASYQPSPFAQSVMQQTMPANAYPTPPPIVNDPATSSLKYALGRPPGDYLDEFVDDRAARMTPKKRKSMTQLESPTIKRSAPNTPATSVPATPSTGGSMRRKMVPYVDVPPKPWLTPRTTAPSTPMTTPVSRRTGDRDERAPSEKLSELLEDVFEAEDSLPADPSDDQLPEEFFVPGFLLAPGVIKRITKYMGQISRPVKRMGASPRKGGGEVDKDVLSRILKMLEKSIKAGLDIEPFPPPASKSGPTSSPKKKGKSKSPDVESIDMEAISSQLSLVYLSIISSECVLCLLSHSGHASLRSEELLSHCFNAIKSALEKVIYPFVEAPSSTVEVCAALVSLLKQKDEEADRARKYISDTFQTISAALPRISSLINTTSTHPLSEALIITSVYIAIGPFFVAADLDVDGSAFSTKGKGKEKDNILGRTLGKSSMRGLRLEALGLIRSVFAQHEEQRNWIIEEILSNLIKLNEGGKQKTGQFRLRDGRQIRTPSALLLQLVQTSAHDVRHTAVTIEKERRHNAAIRKQESFASVNSQASQSSSEKSPSELLNDSDSEAMQLYGGALDSATKAAKTIVLFLTTRSGKTKTTKNTNEAEYRAILDNFISDLLIVLYQPEWPAAALVLSVVCKFMVSSLDDIKNSNTPADSNAAKSIALDHLGVIAAKIRGTVLRLKSQLSPDEKPLKPMEEVISDADISGFNRLITAHRDVASHLSKRASEDQAYDSAREFTAATLGQELAGSLKQINIWVTDDDDGMSGDLENLRDKKKLRTLGEKVRSEMRDLWKDSQADVFDVGSQEEASRIDSLTEQIGVVQSLRNSFHPILNKILFALDASQIFMRTKALRALGQIVTSDAAILGTANVRRSIESHLLDSSPQVRDAAVELIGKYMIESPEVASSYYPKIAERIADTGLSVRKRVIKLLKSFYAVTDDRQLHVDIATRLILRMLDEDDTVKDLAVKTIEDLWFPPLLPQSALKTRGASNTSSNDEKVALQNKVAVVIGVSASFANDRQSPLEDMLHKIISAKEGNEANSLHKRYSEICETIIDDLVDASELSGSTTVNCMRTLYLFTSAYPSVLSGSNASILLPYLKATNPEEQTRSDYILKILRVSIPYLPKSSRKFGQDLQLILQPMIIKPSVVGGVQTLQETVACMCSVVEHLTHDFPRLSALLKSCDGMLNKALKRSKEPPIGPSEVKTWTGLILIISLLCEHCNFDRIRTEHPDLAPSLNMISERPIIEHVYSNLLQLYGKHESTVLRSRILQCLGFLFRAQPTLMTLESSAAIMDAIFSSSDEEARSRLLKIIQDFLISEASKHSQKVKSADKSKGQPSKINMDEFIGNTDGFADSGVSSAIVQRYLNHILDAALSKQPVTQASAFDILSFTIKQGLAHPLQSFPVVVSLETSANQSVSNRAAALHSLMHSKHASIVNTRHTVSARKSFEYQKSLVGAPMVKGYRIASPAPIALLQRWYSLVRDKRPTRQDFLKAMVKVFQENPSYEASQDNIDFTRYMAENFATLEYKTQEEVLTVIKHLTLVLSTTGMQVLEMVSPNHLLASIRPYSTNDAEQPIDNAMDIDGQAQARQGGDSVPLMRITVIISMVMLLKAHLKTLYSLSEEKCAKFELNKKSAVGDRPATRKNQKPISWDRLPFASEPIVTTTDIDTQKSRFLEIWNEDGVSAEPEDEIPS